MQPRQFPAHCSAGLAHCQCKSEYGHMHKHTEMQISLRNKHIQTVALHYSQLATVVLVV